jgi:hypothetical protein
MAPVKGDRVSESFVSVRAGVLDMKAVGEKAGILVWVGFEIGLGIALHPEKKRAANIHIM